MNHPHDLILHLTETVIISPSTNYIHLHFQFSVDSCELLLKKGNSFYNFCFFQYFFMSFSINLSNTLAGLINLLRKDNEVSFALVR